MNDVPIEKLRDHKFYLENFCKVKSKNKTGLVPFILNEAQKDFFNVLHKHKRVMILKARQLGFSVGTTGYFYVDTITNPGTNTGLVGYNAEMCANLLDMVKTLYRTTPKQLRPILKEDSKYAMSFPKLDSKIFVLPCTDDVGRGYTLHNCLAGDTKLFVENGKTKEIKDIREGDIVINGNGGRSKIKKIIKRKTDKEMVLIKGNGMQDAFKLTIDHKILTRHYKDTASRWIMAGDIKIGDYVAYPYFQVRERFKKIEVNDYIKKGYKSRAKKFPKFIDLNYSFGLFVGWYLAEGSIVKNNKICFSIDKDEVEEVTKVVNPYAELFDCDIVVSSNKKSRTRIIHLYNSNFARFIKDYFGCKTKKRIDDAIWYWGKDFVDGLLFGIFSGDGYLKNDRFIHLVTTNESIANQVRKLLVSRRIGLANIYKNESFRYGKKGLDRYDVKLSGKGNYKFRRKFGLKIPIYDNGRHRWILKNAPSRNYGFGSWRRGKFHYWSRIEKIESIPTEEYVYDISIEKPPFNFLTTAGVAHNCLATELSSWENAEHRMAGLEQSVPENGTLVVESTPRGIGNLYHRMWMTENEYVKKEYGWWWGYTKEFMAMKLKSLGPRMFAQEYGLKFLESGRPVFDPKMVDLQRKNILKVGAKNDEHTVIDKDGWVIYRPPSAGGIYVCGADVAQGVEGGDYSFAVIIDRKTGEEVAMFRGKIDANKFAESLNKTGRWYNNCLMAVEINASGLTVVLRLKELVYPSMYFRTAKFETIAATTTDKLGWRTTPVTRPILIDELSRVIREGFITIHSKEILDEMTTFVFNDNNDMVPMHGFYDDGIFAIGIALQGFKVLYSGELTQLDTSTHLPISFAY